VKTSLNGLGAERTALLLRRGYLLAMANCHVVLGYPLVADGRARPAELEGSGL
jgi:hypothetical protein